TSLI
ncbi:hypothetical protein D018_1432B, partial [Vibrio parahaemolyticus VP2007-007]